VKRIGLPNGSRSAQSVPWKRTVGSWVNSTPATQRLVRRLAVIGLKDQPAARATLGHLLADLRHGLIVISRRCGQHQAELEVGLLSGAHGKPRHEAEIGIRVKVIPSCRHRS
jgi:hypothetical protein